MAFQTIGDINLAIADREAGAVERGAKDLTTLGSNIQGGMNNALESASVLQKQAIDEQMQKDADAILKTGIEGIGRYGEELNSQGANLDVQMYKNLASTTKDPKELKNYYILMNKQAEKQRIDNKRAQGAAQLSQALPDIRAKIDDGSVTNKDFDSLLTSLDQTKATYIGDKELTTEYDKTIDNIRSLKEKTLSPKASADKTNAIAEKLNLSRAEAKHFDTRIKESKIIRDKADGVMIAVSRAVDDVQSGKDPNNLTIDQVLGVSLQKVLDPPSVVRESEFDRLKMGQAFFSMLSGKLKSLADGGTGLTDESRARTTQFIKDMAGLANRNIRKEMLTVGVRSGFGERYNPAEIDATMFSADEVAKMKDMHEGNTTADESAIDERIKENVEWFLRNPDTLSNKHTRPSDLSSSGAKPPKEPAATAQSSSPAPKDPLGLGI